MSNDRASHKIPARKDKTVVLTVTTTSRVYDLGKAIWGLVKATNEAATPSSKHLVYIQMQAETVDTYYLFNSTSTVTVDDTAASSEGGAGSNAVSFVANGADRIVKDTSIPFDMNLLTDRYLAIKSASASGKLRITITSQVDKGRGEP